MHVTQWEKLQKIRSKFEANVNGILYVYNNVLMSITMDSNSIIPDWSNFGS